MQASNTETSQYSFNKTRDSFTSDADFNSYLEMVEQYGAHPCFQQRGRRCHSDSFAVANLSGGEDKESTREAIEKYQRDHAQDITLAAAAGEAAAVKWQQQQAADTSARMARAAAAAAADDAERDAAAAAADEAMQRLLGEPAAAGTAATHHAVQGRPLHPHIPLPAVPEPKLVAPATSRTAAARAYWRRAKGCDPPPALLSSRDHLLRAVNAPRNAAAGFSMKQHVERMRRQALAAL